MQTANHHDINAQIQALDQRITDEDEKISYFEGLAASCRSNRSALLKQQRELETLLQQSPMSSESSPMCPSSPSGSIVESQKSFILEAQCEPITVPSTSIAFSNLIEVQQIQEIPTPEIAEQNVTQIQQALFLTPKALSLLESTCTSSSEMNSKATTASPAHLLSERVAKKKRIMDFMQKNEGIRKEGDNWLLIEGKWMESFKAYLRDTSGASPGPIPNHLLLDSQNNPLPGFVSGKDYKARNPKVYEFLHQQFGGGPMISRATTDIYISDSAAESSEIPEVQTAIASSSASSSANLIANEARFGPNFSNHMEISGTESSTVRKRKIEDLSQLNIATPPIVTLSSASTTGDLLSAADLKQIKQTGVNLLSFNSKALHRNIALLLRTLNLAKVPSRNFPSSPDHFSQSDDETLVWSWNSARNLDEFAKIAHMSFRMAADRLEFLIQYAADRYEPHPSYSTPRKSPPPTSTSGQSAANAPIKLQQLSSSDLLQFSLQGESGVKIRAVLHNVDCKLAAKTGWSEAENRLLLSAVHDCSSWYEASRYYESKMRSGWRKRSQLSCQSRALKLFLAFGGKIPKIVSPISLSALVPVHNNAVTFKGTESIGSKDEVVRKMRAVDLSKLERPLRELGYHQWTEDEDEAVIEAVKRSDGYWDSAYQQFLRLNATGKDARIRDSFFSRANALLTTGSVIEELQVSFLQSLLLLQSSTNSK